MASTIYPAPVDTANLLIPNATQHIYEGFSRKDLFKDVFQMWSLGVDLPISRRQQLTGLYTNRNYEENWLLHRYRQRLEIFVIQDSVDITGTLPPSLTSLDTTTVTPDDHYSFYDDLDFYTSNDLTLAWNYRRIKPTADRMINATGRSMALIYRYMKANLADSLAFTVDDGMPRDMLIPAKRPFTVNEYVGAYTERVGLPFRNTLTWEVVAAYRNLSVKPYTVDGGFLRAASTGRCAITWGDGIS